MGDMHLRAIRVKGDVIVISRSARRSYSSVQTDQTQR